MAPLLWIVTPVEVRVYDAFRGIGTEEDRGPVGTYRLNVDTEMAALDEFCGRFSLDTGAFWASDLAQDIHRSGKIDRVLLEEIAALEQRLVKVSLASGEGITVAEARAACQELVTGTLFASYLLDRGGIADPFDEPHRIAKVGLADLFQSRSWALSLFDWLHETFNGDVFPQGMGSSLQDGHLPLLQDFCRGTSLRERDAGQMRLFRFRFDTVPIELISSVYEAFARRAASDMARELGLHYTPVELVHMALDPVFEDLDASARILDPTCGSGLFLVQGLRRLAWKRCGDGPRPRAVIRDILYRQVHGVDIQRAALRIAAFSLYLAALELETTCEPEESVRFEPLIGRTLHEMDFLSVEARELARGLGIDAIVGNPPWTHATKNGEAGAVKKARAKEDDSGSGRSPDHRFLLAAIDVVGRSGRIAMYLKATPFMSRMWSARRFVERVLRDLDRIALINMSPLRQSGLFSEAMAPGLFLCANCGSLPPADRLLVGTFPWTDDFERSGALALSSADIAEAEKAAVTASPSYLKASALGTPRDIALIERFEREFISLETFLSEAGVASGQGFQIKGEARDKPKAVPEAMLDLPSIEPVDYVPVSLEGRHKPTLRQRGYLQLLHARSRDLYRAPLVVFPKSAHKRALQLGRTSAALSDEDLAFSHGFYGFSFAEADPRLPAIICALLNSAVPSYQFLLGAGPLGMERPNILLQDLRALRIPRFEVTDALARRAVQALAGARLDGCAAIDAFVADLYKLRQDERALVLDGVERGRSTLLGTNAARRHDIEAPEARQLAGYAAAACRTVNAVLRISGRQHLVAEVAAASKLGDDRLDRFATVRFRTVPGRAPANVVSEMPAAEAEQLLGSLRHQLVRSPTPYLRERRSLRIYDGAQVTMIKPAQKRYWTVAAGLQDGDTILADHPPGRA
ncbi:SAM-dependent DNA methyltransferase [Methylorubrum populi]|uniref:N-6 DNA methylase n=1 Tax=Methylorubrum rhodesianum TaxID=29427 RepID=UPI00190B50A8|nr:N-6 DNA methylase [Methylorubrum rhodesianum]MBK3402672.1 SAM-dependent DNA methyltransferase [Methylorubrum rhodesianum]MBY0142940.1 SAM-dependent DNA methyltransferase [Methylorubrum populi]